VELLWENAYGKEYEIQISNDTENWTTVYKVNSILRSCDSGGKIDEGPMLLMIENYRTGMVWNTFMKNKYVRSAVDSVFKKSPCTPYDLDKSATVNIFDVVAGLVYLSGNTDAIYNEECSARNGQKIDLLDLFILIYKIEQIKFKLNFSNYSVKFYNFLDFYLTLTATPLLKLVHSLGASINVPVAIKASSLSTTRHSSPFLKFLSALITNFAKTFFPSLTKGTASSAIAILNLGNLKNLCISSASFL
jgi:hypothetical protein